MAALPRIILHAIRPLLRTFWVRGRGSCRGRDYGAHYSSDAQAAVPIHSSGPYRREELRGVNKPWSWRYVASVPRFQASYAETFLVALYTWPDEAPHKPADRKHRCTNVSVKFLVPSRVAACLLLACSPSTLCLKINVSTQPSTMIVSLMLCRTLGALPDRFHTR